ncbi:MAG TPA: hypothetical protein VEI02_04020 [Planctomycetota bacterium]|nr:hypothetical protein [Planctomycetota bacterium]
MKECPEIKDLARFVETGDAEADVAEHARSCEACRAACETLEDEVLSLQISISELWFREEVSCPTEAEVAAYCTGGLDADARKYLEFHLQDLDCARCQGAVGEAENRRNEEGRRRTTRSKARVDDASVKLIGEMKTRRSP